MALAWLLYGGEAAELNKAARLWDRLAGVECQQTPLVYQQKFTVSTGLLLGWWWRAGIKRRGRAKRREKPPRPMTRCLTPQIPDWTLSA